MRTKSFQHLTPRLINNLQEWGKVKIRAGLYWSKDDSELNLLLEALKQEMTSETYLLKKNVCENSINRGNN